MYSTWDVNKKKTEAARHLVEVLLNGRKHNGVIEPGHPHAKEFVSARIRILFLLSVKQVQRQSPTLPN